MYLNPPLAMHIFISKTKKCLDHARISTMILCAQVVLASTRRPPGNSMCDPASLPLPSRGSEVRQNGKGRDGKEWGSLGAGRVARGSQNKGGEG